MEPDKFEKYIKSKLEEREITPSKNAWTRISSQLIKEDKKPKRGYLWYGVAASIIIVVGISIFYINSGMGEALMEESIVEMPTKVKPEESSEIDSELTPEINSNTIVLEESFEEEIKRTETKPVAPKAAKERISLKENTNRDVALVSNKEKILDTFNVGVVPEDVLNSKIEEILAQVDVLEQSTELTDAEVDSLLRMAQEDILTKKLFNPNNTVDAITLLTEVEDELDQSFRNQIFESLKTGFLKVRTAVADRNN
ncbi:MAG: hypothetical protein WBB27_07590 [Maribacter sp.]